MTNTHRRMAMTKITSSYLGMLEDCSNNLLPGELDMAITDGGYILMNTEGTKLFCPEYILDGAYDEKNMKLHACMQYLFRYKYPQFDPSSSPVLGKKIAHYTSVLENRWINSFHRFEARQARLLQEKFRVKEGTHILECGGFIGFSTVRMAQQVGVTGRVLTCEAMLNNYTVIKHNVASNCLENVVVSHCATAERDKSITIYKSQAQRNSIVKGVVEHTDVDIVDGFSIESICKQHNYTPDFIILSINGAELMAIDGSLEYLASLKDTRIIAVGKYNDSQGCIAHRLLNALSSIGYAVFIGKGLYIFAFN